MNKRKISIFIALCMLFSLFSTVVYADDVESQSKEIISDIIDSKEISSDTVGSVSGTCGENLVWSLNNGTLTISGTGEMTNFLMSPTYPWDFDITKINTIVIEKGVTNIGGGAFYGFTGLETITIPDTITSIGDFAFIGCEKLMSITIPSSVTSIGSDAFDGCTALTGVHISDISAWCRIEFVYFYSNPLYYADKLYVNGVLIENLVIPETVTSINRWAFQGCYGLKSVTIPDTVTSIGDYAFESCAGLTSVTIGNSVTSIGDYAFSYCKRLTSVSIGNSVTSIGYEAFCNCTGLTSVTIPNSVTSIDGYAFSYCKELASVNIPDSVKSIGRQAFEYCDNLKSITIGKGVTSIGHSAFGYSDAGVIDGFTITGYVDSAAEEYAKDNGFIFIDITSITHPEADSDVYFDTETNTMPNIVAKTTAEAIISSLSAYGINATVTDKDGNAMSNTAFVGTGCKVTDQNGNTYTVIVKGDIDGTGIVNSTDYIQIKKMFLGTISLENEYFAAADTDNTGKINSTDYLQVKKYFLGQIDLYV